MGDKRCAFLTHTLLRGAKGAAPRLARLPFPALPPLQLVQAIKQAAGTVRHGGGAEEAPSELLTRARLLACLAAAVLGAADLGLGHGKARSRGRRRLAPLPAARRLPGQQLQ